jgi:hypothetical protein
MKWFEKGIGNPIKAKRPEETEISCVNKMNEKQ